MTYIDLMRQNLNANEEQKKVTDLVSLCQGVYRAIFLVVKHTKDKTVCCILWQGPSPNLILQITNTKDVHVCNLILINWKVGQRDNNVLAICLIRSNDFCIFYEDLLVFTYFFSTSREISKYHRSFMWDEWHFHFFVPYNFQVCISEGLLR